MPDTQFVVSDWLIGYPENTRAGYRLDVTQFEVWLGGDLLAASRVDVQRWVSHLRDEVGLASSTVNRKTSAVWSFFNYCVQERIVEANPAEHVRRPRIENSPRFGLTVDDARRLLEAASARSVAAHALVWLMAGAGLRVSEAVGARIEDLAGAVLSVRVKGGTVQNKPLSAPVLAAVEAAAGDRESGPIVTNPDGHRLSRRGALRVIDELASEVGVDCSPHVLRHTAATLALEAGAPLQDVSRLLGHRSLETTLKYVRNRDADGGMRLAAETLGETLMNPGFRP